MKGNFMKGDWDVFLECLGHTPPENQFNKKFATDIDEAGKGTNAFVLTSDGCFMRHDEPRTRKEAIMPMLNESLRSNRQEQRLQQDVFQLIAVGLQPDLEETLEEFVIKHADMLE